MGIINFKKGIFKNKPTLFFAIASVWPVIGFLPGFPALVMYGVTLVYAAYCLSMTKKMNELVLALLIYIPIELILVQPPSVFQSWPRYVFFAALLMNVSPLLQSKKLRIQRRLIFQFMMWACVFIGVGSFFARFLGINFMTISSADLIFQTGTFGGLTTHSMMLGPIAGIAACYLTSIAMVSKRKWVWIWVFLALFAVLFSASRAALMAAIAGVIITAYRQSGSTNKFLQVGIVALVISASTYSLWEGALSGVIEKNTTTSGLNYDSRQSLWENRIAEFKDNPVLGVGFCATSMNDTLSVDLLSGRVETGSSWLIIFSMLGLIGACMIFPIFFRAVSVVYKRRDKLSSILCGVLTLFFVHMFAEGYVFAGGSFMAFMLWLTVGIAVDSKYRLET